MSDWVQFGKTPLWEHQIEDLCKLKDQAHVLIGNDMGTGKTYTAGERDAYLRATDLQCTKTLVVSPLATHGFVASDDSDGDGWMGMFSREYPHLKVSVIDPKARHKFLRPDCDVYIMHPEALRLMPELRDFGFDHIIADECQAFKNRQTKQTKALKKIKVPYKTAMSGSPATDHPHDLWSILNWLKPQQYSSYWAFYKKAVEFEIIYPGGFHKVTGPTRWWETVGLDEIRPWYVRRLKDDCMDLPDKIYEVVKVQLPDKNRRAYDQMHKDMIAWVGENENKPIVAPAVIARLIRLQQMAIAYLDFDYENHTVTMCEPSPKVDAAVEIILDNPESSFVVYSQFKPPLKMLANKLAKKGVKVAEYTGDISKAQRAINKADFVNRDARVFAATLRSGGVGIDGLQHVCNNAIFLDRDWSPMINIQAEDRLHRGGTVKHPLIIDIMAINTVDQGRKQKIELKWEWIKRMLGDKTIY